MATQYGSLSLERQMIRILITVLSFKKTSKNRQNHSVFRIHLFSEVFGRFLKRSTINKILTIYRLFTRQSYLDRHPYWVFCTKVRPGQIFSQFLADFFNFVRYYCLTKNRGVLGVRKWPPKFDWPFKSQNSTLSQNTRHGCLSRGI